MSFVKPLTLKWYRNSSKDTLLKFINLSIKILDKSINKSIKINFSLSQSVMVVASCSSHLSSLQAQIRISCLQSQTNFRLQKSLGTSQQAASTTKSLQRLLVFHFKLPCSIGWFPKWSSNPGRKLERWESITKEGLVSASESYSLWLALVSLSVVVPLAGWAERAGPSGGDSLDVVCRVKANLTTAQLSFTPALLVLLPQLQQLLTCTDRNHN